MKKNNSVITDGNEAVASIAFRRKRNNRNLPNHAVVAYGGVVRGMGS